MRSDGAICGVWSVTRRTIGRWDLSCSGRVRGGPDYRPAGHPGAPTPPPWKIPRTGARRGRAFRPAPSGHPQRACAAPDTPPRGLTSLAPACIPALSRASFSRGHLAVPARSLNFRWTSKQANCTRSSAGTTGAHRG